MTGVIALPIYHERRAIAIAGLRAIRTSVVTQIDLSPCAWRFERSSCEIEMGELGSIDLRADRRDAIRIARMETKVKATYSPLSNERSSDRPRTWRATVTRRMSHRTVDR